MLTITPKHKAIRAYYQELNDFNELEQTHEGTVKIAFQHLLEACAKQCHWVLIQEQTLKRSHNKRIRLDGVLFDSSHLVRGYWEAKDVQDDLSFEVEKKRYQDDYPQDNIIFQTPERAILIQNGREISDVSLNEPLNLVQVINTFFNFKRPEYEHWGAAADEFKTRVPKLAQKVLALIQKARSDDHDFKTAFNRFANQCRQAINPNLADAALEEMLIQHLLTERIFRRIFNHPDFAKRNIIAREIENVIDKLTAQAFNRDAFFEELKYFYKALEEVAATIDEYRYKQHFLNTVYERFFQGFSVKVADTHGIVYTPQAIVDFMVKSVDEILQQEFGKSLGSKGVHIIDPFVGTGNFMVRIMREIAAKSRLDLNQKYQNELHCNEIMLLPYYIASMNIEYEYLELMGQYQAYEGICLADTFELAEEKQIDLFVPANTERVKKQQETDFFVIIGNPPYNAWQLNENDNNKNRQYQTIDRRIKETYVFDSKATNKNALFDPYVKAIRWATDRIDREGIVAFVTNNGFLDNLAFEGMRKHLAQDFLKIYVLDLGGNLRKNPGKTSNVFDIKVGVSITFLVKSLSKEKGIFYACLDESLSKADKLQTLENQQQISGITWERIEPDKNQVWLNHGLQSEFEDFVPLGVMEEKRLKTEVEGVIFKHYSNGVKTNRDVWAYNFNPQKLAENMQRTIAVYNQQVSKLSKWIAKRSNRTRFDKLTENEQNLKIDNFVLYDDSQLNWSESLKSHLKRGHFVDFESSNIRHALYRPFTRTHLYFERTFNERVYLFPSFFPTLDTENRILCVGAYGRKPFSVLMADRITDINFYGDPQQSFSFYTYLEDGTNRIENITDWALNHYQKHYLDSSITKWAIFYYVYGLLHHWGFREKYAANLKRELPRLPMAPDFWAFAKAGETLADWHLNYEQHSPYPLNMIENPKLPFSLRVSKMKLSPDKKQLIYNHFLTLDGIPKPVFDYKLGNRSALEWVIDQYRVKVNKRSGIINDPNQKDDEEYIVELVKKVITVSLETVKVIEKLADFKLRTKTR